MDALTAPAATDPESPARRLDGGVARLALVLAVGLALYAIYWALGIVQPQIYRTTFLLVALVLTFLVYPGSSRGQARVAPLDWVLVCASIGALLWPVIDFERFIYRAATPTTVDLVMGSVTILLVLEATRRTAGAVLPITAAAFIAYAVTGHELDRVGLGLIAHRGYDLERLVGTLYMTLEGIFGVPLDVAATYIVLFAVYGAVLNASGADRFFLDWSLAAVGRTDHAAGPGRAIIVGWFSDGSGYFSARRVEAAGQC